MLRPASILPYVLSAVLLGCSACSRSPEPTPASRVLAAPPLVGRPTASSATLRLVNGGAAAEVRLLVGGREAATAGLAPRATHDFAVDGLAPGTEVRYQVVARSGELEETAAGRFVTRRPPGSAFTFAVLGDPHLPVPSPEWLEPENDEEMRRLVDYHVFRAEVSDTLRRGLAAIRAARPDFVVCLGDMFTLSAEEFNPPFPSAELAEAAYVDFRGHLGRTGAEAAFFAVIGNWDGENGWHSEKLVAHARAARSKYLANPTPDTYAEGGGPFADYYAWTWGDALFVVLNVMSYTATVHTLDASDDGTATSWTLGEAQWEWLEATLAASAAPLKMIFIHHTVGGNAGDELNSAYGRGGGRAARVGEQERLHELMIARGVQVFFYGHDHVFTDQVVDGIHYVLPGSAGAPWKFPAEETGYEDFDERSGFGLVRVLPSEVRIEFRDLEGEMFRTIRIDR